MAQITMKRSGRTVTVSDKLARALVKGGRYDYVRSDLAAEPVAVAQSTAAPDEPEQDQEAAPTRAKRAYKRRDMQAQ